MHFMAPLASTKTSNSMFCPNDSPRTEKCRLTFEKLEPANINITFLVDKWLHKESGINLFNLLCKRQNKHILQMSKDCFHKSDRTPSTNCASTGGIPATWKETSTSSILVFLFSWPFPLSCPCLNLVTGLQQSVTRLTHIGYYLCTSVGQTSGLAV